MKNVIIYYSETNNTKDLAYKINEEIESDIFEVNEISVEDILNYENILLGCPALGTEELSPEMEDLTNELRDSLKDQSIYLFGSYGWGDGQWIRDWESSFNGFVKNTFMLNEGIENLDDGLFIEFIDSVR